MTTQTDDETQDDMIFKERLLGGSARAVAERFNIRIGAVEAIVENKMLRLDVGYRARTASLDAERLEALLFRYMRSALAGDTDATYLVLRLLERRSALLGLDCPMKIDPVQINVAPQESSTARLEKVFEDLRLMRDRSGGSTATDRDDPPSTH